MGKDKAPLGNFFLVGRRCHRWKDIVTSRQYINVVKRGQGFSLLEMRLDAAFIYRWLRYAEHICRKASIDANEANMVTKSGKIATRLRAELASSTL